MLSLYSVHRDLMLQMQLGTEDAQAKEQYIVCIFNTLYLSDYELIRDKHCRKRNKDRQHIWILIRGDSFYTSLIKDET